MTFKEWWSNNGYDKLFMDDIDITVVEDAWDAAIQEGFQIEKLETERLKTLLADRDEEIKILRGHLQDAYSQGYRMKGEDSDI